MIDYEKINTEFNSTELAFNLEIKILNQRYLFYRLTKSLQQEIQSSKQLYELWRNK